MRRAGRLLVALAGLAGAAYVGGTISVPSSAVALDDLTGKVITVNGPVDPGSLGITLPHEHLFIDLNPPSDTTAGWRAIGEERPSSAEARAFYLAPLTIERLGLAYAGRPNRDNLRLDSEASATAAVLDFKYARGGTIVDVTSVGIKRQPAALRRVSRATGVAIVMGSGWYEHGYVGALLDQRPASSLASAIVNDIAIGVDGTGIRSGIIGEIGVKEARQPYERKILAAAAEASQRTGAAISIHMSRGHHEQLATLEILKAAGADLSRVAMGHSNPIADDMDLMKRVLAQGAFLQFDLLGDPPTIMSEVPDHDVAVAIAALIKQGYGKQILLSQDVCVKTDLKAYGGSGYAFVAEQFVPYLKRMGVTDQQVDEMIIDNPRRLLTFVAPQDPKR